MYMCGYKRIVGSLQAGISTCYLAIIETPASDFHKLTKFGTGLQLKMASYNPVWGGPALSTMNNIYLFDCFHGVFNLMDSALM